MPYVKKINGYDVKDEEARNQIRELQLAKANASEVDRLALDNAKLTEDLMEAETLIQELQQGKANASDVEQLVNDSAEHSQSIREAENHISELQTGKAEKETVEQLQQETSELSQNLTEANNKITALENKDGDYVVSQGTIGIWNYRKWNSGIAECWGKSETLNVDIDVPWGTFFSKDDAIPSYEYPFEFIDYPVVTMSEQKGFTNYWIYSGASGTTTQTPSVSLMRPNEASVSATIHYHVIGKWK